MDNKIIWNKLKASGFDKIELTFEDFVKLLDCYYGSIFISNGEGKVIYFNEAYYASLGLSREELLGKHVNYLLGKKYFDRSTTLECLKKRDNITFTAKDKTGRDIFIYAVPIFDDDDNIIYIVQFGQHESSISLFLEEIAKNREMIETIYGALEHITKTVGDGMAMIYKSEAMAQVCNLAKTIAKTDGTVILYGQSGTGKEVLARYIYKESNRAKEIFIPVNCAAIPSELMESELFGYVPGAFTGAKKEGKPGLFELANNGTIFLDEIGELPILLQPKLLRVLETGEVTRIGANMSKSVNVRIIAATNRDLKSMITERTFREDLYYRLSVIPITIPSLQERVEDIEVLANYFLEVYNKKYKQNKTISDSCMNSFKNYNWPGNIREMKNLIHRLVITTSGEILDTTISSNLDTKIHTSLPAQKDEVHFKGQLKKVMHDYEIQYMSAVLKECNGNVTEAAKKLGIHRSFIYRKLGK